MTYDPEIIISLVNMYTNIIYSTNVHVRTLHTFYMYTTEVYKNIKHISLKIWVLSI